MLSFFLSLSTVTALLWQSYICDSCSFSLSRSYLATLKSFQLLATFFLQHCYYMKSFKFNTALQKWELPHGQGHKGYISPATFLVTGLLFFPGSESMCRYTPGFHIFYLLYQSPCQRHLNSCNWSKTDLFPTPIIHTPSNIAKGRAVLVCQII